MTELSRQRRQLLLYVGLGMVGTFTADVLGFKAKTIKPTPAIAAASEPPLVPLTTDLASTEISARPPAGKLLPEFQGIREWLNSEPLSISALKGSVILVQFWTLSCINCQRTLPYLTQWHRQYAVKGLQVIGVHTPEFAFERDVNTIKKALKQYQITYPVPIDNEFKTWKAYNNQYWPQLYLADRQGNLRYGHSGEGAYAQTEQIIRQLLA
jgi:thiol-disulfide isomerase/thioredoxin